MSSSLVIVTCLGLWRLGSEDGEAIMKQVINSAAL